jgi:hypothetical protein
LQAGFGVFGIASRLRIAKKNQHGIANELVDGAAMRERDLGHFGKIFIEQLSDLLRLQPFRGRGEILDVGEEDGEPLPLGLDSGVLFVR